MFLSDERVCCPIRDPRCCDINHTLSNNKVLRMYEYATRRHLSPALYAILTGSIVGFWRILPELTLAGYIKHHMYFTSLRILMTRIDIFVLMLCLAFYAFHMGRLHRSMFRIPCYVVSGVTFIHIVDVVFDWRMWLHRTFRGLETASFIRQIVADGLPQIIISIILIIAGIAILYSQRSRRAANDNDIQYHASDSSQTIPTWPNRILQIAKPIILIIPGLFLIANASWLILLIKNAHDIGSKPNVIYVMVDTLRADHLSCYGYNRNTSPNIDDFAKDSMRFSKAIAQAPWTTASISSFMSGRYISTRCQDVFGYDVPPTDVVLMPELLRDKGYITAAVISNPLAGKSACLDRGYDKYYEIAFDVKRPQGKHQTPKTVLSKTIEMIRQMKGKRFFLFAHFMGPHSPYAAHPEFNFYPGYKGGLNRDVVYPEDHPLFGDDLTFATALYDGEIAYTDHYIGLLLSELKKQGQYDNTVIVLLSDHGEELNEHGAMTHGTHLYEDTISVPLIVKLPNQQKGSVVGGVFPLVDLLPSVAEYIGCNSTALEFDGTALPLYGLKSVRTSRIRSSTEYLGTHLESLSIDATKLILDKNTNHTEMFDLSKDPGERQNITANEPKLRTSLEAALEGINRQIEAKLDSTIRQHISSTEQQANRATLRALGYLQ